jgi:hypothetical protein
MRLSRSDGETVEFRNRLFPECVRQEAVMRRRVTWPELVLLSTVLALLGSGARAANWADPLFSERSHDFGPVPRGAKVRHNFVLNNKLSEPLTILDVRASCGCTTGRASSNLVPPGQSAEVEAEMDTRNFVGRKDTVLHVSVVTAGGKHAEVRLGVGSTILSDLVLNPGTIDFGVVARGQAPSQVLTIERVDVPSWRIERMVSTCRVIDANVVETSRKGPIVSYQLTVSLKPDAPAGAVRDEIRLVSNDRDSPIIPVQVTAMVRGELSASPSTLALGHATSSSGVQGRFLVRASKPFTVRNVEGTGDGFKLLVDDTSPKALHILTLSYNPEEGTTRGDLRRTFRVVTDLPGEPPLELTATLSVSP